MLYTFIMDLAANLFFILFCVLLFQFWVEKKDLSVQDRKNSILILTCVAIVLCMSFPIKISNNFIFDLRHVPIVIGGLYGGPYVLAGIMPTAIIYRYLLGGDGFYASLLIYAIEIIVLLLSYHKYQHKTPTNRMTFAVIFTFVIATTVAFIVEYSSNQPLLGINYWLIYIFGNTLGMLITVKMIEAVLSHMQMRHQLIRNEKLEAVSQLASSISHEVRNPLTTSRGFMQLLLDSDLAEDQKNYIKISIDEMDRAEHIIRDYLTFAKPTVSKLEQVSIDIELKKALDIIKPLANMNNVTTIEKLEPAIIIGEKALFQQCFINLFKNGIEAMEKGGTLTVNSTITINGTIRITITDTGIGMTQLQLQRLGEPYYTTKGMKGTGLGMMVVYRIIHSLNGTIDVKSAPGSGTTFTIELPIYTV
ncbi:two-component sensor histidine kinase [Bacillus sp. HMF5848]|uniref:ATP-binding protein n=1 Tax=Bacillus sp. HMF5848 TaxID=2495421 RepID=UPI000F778541|nr:ATP-binding protein [Bacillus sp. HMF5848]RSK26660.1 two-component sensor histidine kinase [Bacillus sp. HMF5848]